MRDTATDALRGKCISLKISIRENGLLINNLIF